MRLQSAVMTAPGTTDNLFDVYLWPDDFWCFRNEARPEHMRGDEYRVVAVGTPEWSRITRTATLHTPL
jgi:hypothetical protein